MSVIGQFFDTNVFTSDWAFFFDTMIVASIDGVLIITHQNLRLGKSWKLFSATLKANSIASRSLLAWTKGVVRSNPKLGFVLPSRKVSHIFNLGFHS